jgi:hypothetical protein
MEAKKVYFPTQEESDKTEEFFDQCDIWEERLKSYCITEKEKGIINVVFLRLRDRWTEIILNKD